jgi:hypothetical protein
MPVHHTDCDMLTVGDGQVKVAVGAATGVKPFTLEASARRSRLADEPVRPQLVCEVAVAPCGRCWAPRRDHLGCYYGGSQGV